MTRPILVWIDELTEFTEPGRTPGDNPRSNTMSFIPNPEMDDPEEDSAVPPLPLGVRVSIFTSDNVMHAGTVVTTLDDWQSGVVVLEMADDLKRKRFRVTIIEEQVVAWSVEVPY